MSKSIKSTFSINQHEDEEMDVNKQSKGQQQMNVNVINQDIFSFEQDKQGQNRDISSNLIEQSQKQQQQQQQSIPTSLSQEQQAQQPYKKNNSININSKVGVHQTNDGEELNFDDNFILSSPTSNIFKSNEDLFLDSSQQKSSNLKRFEFDTRTLEEEKYFSKFNKPLEYVNLNPTQNFPLKQQNSQLKVLHSSSEQQGQNNQCGEDDFNLTDTPSHKDITMKRMLKEKRETENIDDESSQTMMGKSPQQEDKFKFSLDSIIQKNLVTAESKEEKRDSQGNLNTVTSPNQQEQANSYIRKLTNAQSMNLTSSKTSKKFLARKSEFGLGFQRSQYNNDINTNNSSTRLSDNFVKESKDRQLQQSILEKLQQKNWKFGSKMQRSESVMSNQQIEQKQSERKWSVVNKLCIMIKAKHKLKNLIKQRFSSLSSYERTLIGDYADGKLIMTRNTNEKPKLIQRFIDYSIHPDYYLIILFKIVLLIITILNLTYIPILLGFMLELTNLSLAFITFSSITYIAEIVIKFKTSLYEKGELISDTKTIAKKYLQNGFITDVISIVGLMLGSAEKTFFIFMIFRIINVIRYMDDLNYHYFLAEKYHNLWVLSGLFGFIFLMCHYFACIFHFIGYIREGDDSAYTWIKFEQISDAPWFIRYNYALYFSFITCMTIGYGDVVPKNTEERTAVIIFSFVSTMCFSYSVNTIGNIFQDYFNKFQKQLQYYLFVNYIHNQFRKLAKFFFSLNLGKILFQILTKYIKLKFLHSFFIN